MREYIHRPKPASASARQKKNNAPVNNLLSNFISSETHEEATDKAQETLLDHLVKEGETLYGIAKQYGLTVEQLLEANPQLTWLKEGQPLEIPGLRELYYVKFGDTLSSIVRAYKLQLPDLSVKDIVAKNLQPGVKLSIPDTTTSSKKSEASTENERLFNARERKVHPQHGEITLTEDISFPVVLPDRLQKLLAESAYRSHSVKTGDNLWTIAQSYWSADSLHVNESEHHVLIATIVDDIIHQNNLTLNPDGKIEGFIASEMPALYLLVPYEAGTEENKKENTPKKQKTVEKSTQKILTDEQSAQIGNVMGKISAIVALIEISKKYLGENNILSQFIAKSIGRSPLIPLSFDIIKTGIDLYDGRYKGKPENLIFDSLKIIASLSPYGAILNEFTFQMGIDANSFFAYCKKHNLELPSIGQTKQIIQKDGTKLNYYQFEISPGKYKNFSPKR
ncbi:MAG: LysM peptidoglycan-binding domain-containing protein [Microscillaceae bacterium]|nr:LysM peptidoglycan-binding domain-containing protein [Microscillaceae bacterium]